MTNRKSQVAKGVARIFHWGQPKGRKSSPKAESGVGFLERGSKPCSPARGSGERRELPSVRSKVFFTIFSTQDGLS